MFRIFLDPEKVPTRNPLLLAIIKVESNFDPYAVRYEEDFDLANEPELFARMHGITLETERALQRTSWGLGQILGCTARDRGFKGPLTRLIEPSLNVEFCSKHLTLLMDRYHTSIPDAIAAYNAGVARKTKGDRYVNQGYVDKVMRELPVFQRLTHHGV